MIRKKIDKFYVWELGFDHLAIAVGAGLPRELMIPGSLAPGMRQANDFLMALQLTGAAKATSLANLQVRMPVVVIGGGLTGIDTATEAQAYYLQQIEKAAKRYNTLASVLGETELRAQFDAQALQVLDEFLMHAKEVEMERERAGEVGEKPDFIRLLRSWGGVTIAYRRSLRESPAYQRNHEEITQAFAEGIYFAEGLEPTAARLDEHGHVTALVCREKIYDEQGKGIETEEAKVLPARTIFVATGARPNIAYEYEHRGTFRLEGMEYRSYAEQWVEVAGESTGDGIRLQPQFVYVPPDGHCKTDQFGPFTSYERDQYRVTFLGDTHPVFHGSVVKAIASAKRVYPKIMLNFAERVAALGDVREYQKFAEKIQNLLQATLVGLQRLNDHVIEIEVHAPLAVHNFSAGEFYRVQNYESYAPTIDATKLQTEALALLGTKVDREKGNLHFMVLEHGVSSRLVATWSPGQPLAVMGPTGVRTKIPHDQEKVLIIGDELSVPYTIAVGAALREQNNQVLYCASFANAKDVYAAAELTATTDKIIWITAEQELFKPLRATDLAAQGSVIDVLSRYATGAFNSDSGTSDFPLTTIDRIFIVGQGELLKNLQQALKKELAPLFSKNPPATVSAYGPMQCMLKGVCAQCLQWQIDPATGQRTKAVFTCSWQNQPLPMVELSSLEGRLQQNRMQEILANLWLDYLFTQYSVSRI